MLALMMTPAAMPMTPLAIWCCVICVLAMLCIPQRVAKAALLSLLLAVGIMPLIFYQCQWWDWWC